MMGLNVHTKIKIKMGLNVHIFIQVLQTWTITWFSFVCKFRELVPNQGRHFVHPLCIIHACMYTLTMWCHMCASSFWRIYVDYRLLLVYYLVGRNGCNTSQGMYKWSRQVKHILEHDIPKALNMSRPQKACSNKKRVFAQFKIP